MRLLLAAAALAASIASAQAQTSIITGPNGEYQGTATHYGTSTVFTGPNGQYLGSANNYGNTTTLTGPNGQYQGTVTNSTSSGLPATRRR
jgi:hypothetical protein